MLMIFRVSLGYNTKKREEEELQYAETSKEKKKKTDPNLEFSYCTLMNQSENLRSGSTHNNKKKEKIII